MIGEGPVFDASVPPEQPKQPLTAQELAAQKKAQGTGFFERSARFLASGFSGDMSDVAELGHAYATGGAQKLQEKALYQQALRDEYPVQDLLISTGLPLLSAILSGGGAAVPIVGEKLAAQQGKKAIMRKVVSAGVKEGEQELIERGLARATREGAEAVAEKVGQEALEAGAETGFREIVGVGGKEVLGKVEKKFIPQVVEETIPKPGRIRRTLTTAYKYSPTGLIDKASDVAADSLRKKMLSKGRLGELLAADLPRSQRRFIQNFADDILVRMPSRLAASSAIDIPLFSMTQAIRETAASGDPSWSSFGEHFAGAWAQNALMGAKLTGFFGLAEVGLPVAFRGLKKTIDATAEYAPVFGRQAKFNLWTSADAYEKTGILPDVSKWMSKNKEMVVNAARYWPQKQLGVSFEKYIQDMDADDVEFFVRNHQAIVDAASSFSGSNQKAFVQRLKGLNESQRVWMLERSDAISQVNAVHDGMLDALSSALDGDIQAWSPRAADELLSIAKATTGTAKELGQAVSNLAAAKTNEVSQLDKVLSIAYKRMIRDEDDILSSFGEPGGPPSSQLIVDSAHDLVGVLNDMIDRARSSPNKHAKTTVRRLTEIAKSYQQEVESIVGKDSRRKDKSYTDLMAEVEEYPASYRPDAPRAEAPEATEAAARSMYGVPQKSTEPTYAEMLSQVPRPESGFKPGQAPVTGVYPGMEPKPKPSRSYSEMTSGLTPDEISNIRNKLDSSASPNLAARAKEAAKKAGKSEAKSAASLEDFNKAQFDLFRAEAEKSRKRRSRRLARERSAQKNQSLKSTSEILDDEIDSVSGMAESDIADDIQQAANKSAAPATPTSTLEALTNTPSTGVDGADRFINAMERNGDVVSSQPYIVIKNAEKEIDSKTAIKLARAMRSLRSSIGETVGEAKRRAFSKDEKFTDRFKRAHAVAGSMYHIIKTVLQDEKIWGEAASIRGKVDNLYHDFMSEVGSSGNFRKHFMQNSGKTSADDKVRASISYDKVLKFAKDLTGKAQFKQEADEAVAVAAQKFEELTGEKLPVPKLASETDSWHSMNRILNNTIDVIEKHLGDLVDPPELKASRKDIDPKAYALASAKQTEMFLESLRQISSQSANATIDAQRTMQNRKTIQNALQKAKQNADQLMSDLEPGTGVFGEELSGMPLGRALPNFGPTAKAAMALRFAESMSKQIRQRYQVASQLKAMVDADVRRRMAEDVWTARTQNAIDSLRRGMIRRDVSGRQPILATPTLEEVKKQISYELGVYPEDVSDGQASERLEQYKKMMQEDKEYEQQSESVEKKSPDGSQETDVEKNLRLLRQMEQEDSGYDAEEKQQAPSKPDSTPAVNTEETPLEQYRKMNEEDKEQHTMNIINKARSFVDSPGEVMRMAYEDSEYIASSIPSVMGGSVPTSMKVFSEIASVAPSKQEIVFGQERLNSQQISRVQNILHIVSDPAVIVDRVFDGSLTQDDVGVLDRVYPGVALALRQKVNDAIRQCAADGISVPFGTQCAAERFLGLPVSSSTSVAVARGAQGVYSQGRQNGPGRPRETMTPAMVANRSSGRVYGASNLGMANRLLTDKQRSETRNA